MARALSRRPFVAVGVQRARPSDDLLQRLSDRHVRRVVIAVQAGAGLYAQCTALRSTCRTFCIVIGRIGLVAGRK